MTFHSRMEVFLMEAFEHVPDCHQMFTIHVKQFPFSYCLLLGTSHAVNLQALERKTKP